jgi:hypothetical protein
MGVRRQWAGKERETCKSYHGTYAKQRFDAFHPTFKGLG